VPRDGNNNPNVIDFGHGLLNAVGLPSPGYKNMDMEFNELSKIKDIVIWSIYGSRIEDYIEITEHIIKYNPKSKACCKKFSCCAKAFPKCEQYSRDCLRM